MLITCPECKKEKVSSVADYCPECGFPIKSYFEKIKEKEAKINIEKQQKRSKQENSNNIPFPDKPKFPKGWLIAGLIVLSITIFGFVVGVITGDIDDEFKLIMTMNSFSSLILLGVGYRKFMTAKERYAQAKTNFQQYKMEETKRQIDKFNQEKMKASLQYTPNCPSCGSSNVKNIGILNRAASIAVVGLASGKIGKQFECKKCKYKW